MAAASTTDNKAIHFTVNLAAWTAHDSYPYYSSIRPSGEDHGLKANWMRAMAVRPLKYRSNWTWHTQLITMMSNTRQIPEAESRIVWIVGGPATGKTWFRESIRTVKDSKDIGSPTRVPGNDRLMHFVIDGAGVDDEAKSATSVAAKHGYKSVFYVLCNEAPKYAEHVYFIDEKSGLLVPAIFVDRPPSATATTVSTAAAAASCTAAKGFIVSW